MAYTLRVLDDPNHLEPNGKSILENAMMLITTESGDGRHANSTRELSGIFHAISGSNDRFKTGGLIDLDAHGLDLYNTKLSAHQVPELAPHIDGPVTDILA